MRTQFAALLALTIAAGCAVGGGVVVKGVGSNDLLKLREGPGRDYKIIIGLPDGTRLTRHSCMTNENKTETWCRVSLTAKPGVAGYVSADYLSGS